MTEQTVNIYVNGQYYTTMTRELYDQYVKESAPIREAFAAELKALADAIQ